LIALQIQTFFYSDNAIFVLHKCLRKNSAAVLPYFLDGMADVEVWEEGKPHLAVGCYKLWTQQKG
jgi:hypothetical protein